MGKRKFTLNEVDEYFENEGWVLLSSEYINKYQKLEVLCPEGHYQLKCFGDFKNNKNRCAECCGTRNYTYEEVKIFFEEKGWKLISTEYKNNKSKLEVMCPNNHIHLKTLKNLKKEYNCKKCSKNNKYTYEEVKKFIEELGYILYEDKYENNKQKLKVECPKGHITYKKFNTFKIGNTGCRKCINEYNVGENHPNWNPDRTRKMRAQYLLFKITPENIKECLSHDPNYNNYLNNPEKYEIDHIFPRKAFIDHNIDYKYGAEEAYKLCNDIENLQIITKTENRKKQAKYDELEFLFYIQRYEINKRIKGKTHENFYLFF